MVDTIRLWVTGVTMAAIIGCVVLTLSPKGNCEGAVKTIVSVFLISSMIIPFAKADNITFDFELSEAEDVTVNDKIINSAGEYFCKELESSITQILNSSGIQVSYISIDINTKGEEFSVDKIYVELKKESSDKIYEAEQLLKSQLSIEAQISVED